MDKQGFIEEATKDVRDPLKDMLKLNELRTSHTSIMNMLKVLHEKVTATVAP